MRLQNHPGEKEFPVRSRGSYRRKVAQARVARGPNKAALRGAALVAPGVIISFVLYLNRSRWMVLVPDELRSADLAFPISAAIGALLILLVVGLASARDASLPLREQRRYGADVPDVTDRQQQMLALDGFSDFRFGGWNSSLEYWPADVRLGRTPGTPSPFLTLDPMDRKGVRDQLDKQHRVIDEESLRVFVIEALGDHSVSAKFYRLAVQDAPDAHATIARVAALAKQDEWDVRSRLQSVGGRPPALLWGFDAHRVISAIRMAYIAEYVTEETAWALMEQPAEIAFGVHADRAQFHRSVLVGSAFASDSITYVSETAEVIQAFEQSGWPGSTASFGTASRALPEHVRDVTRLEV